MGLSLFRNRAVIGAVVLLVLIGCWEFLWKPQYRPSFQQGRIHYQRGEYAQALPLLENAYLIQPNAYELVTLLGWTHMKLRETEKARYYFQRALKIEPDSDEARLGIAALTLDAGEDVDIAQLERILERRPSDPDVTALLAAAHIQAGNNSAGANLYRLLLSDKNYREGARKELEKIFGLQGFSDAIPAGLAPLIRPENPQAPFRAAEGSMWRLRNGNWEKYYVTGVNFGPAAPGYFAAGPPLDGQIYLKYLQQIRQMNANVVRAYTLLPPSFYRAFKHAAANGSNLLLYQQIWIASPPEKDLFDARFVEESKSEIRYVVDALHGRGDVPWKHARGSGLYVNDIAGRVGAILLGREIEPSTVVETNLRHRSRTSYAGNYISVENATATEVWFAQMLDYLVGYEAKTYNWQHPVAVVNWPPLDPLTHPTESTIHEEIKYRIAAGEKLALLTGPQDDDDNVSIDESKFRPLPGFQAGLFASYHVYPYYPDFLTNDPTYLAANDKRGPNPLMGYLRELRAHIPFPLVVTEYGIPSSIGISHFHPLGWHHGGHSEDRQAELLVRFTRSVREADCAGGIVFELLDEWYKQNWLTVDFEKPSERASLWINELDPEKHFGLIGFRTSKWKLFADEPGAWDSEAVVLEEDGVRLQAALDEGFLYLRLSGICARCVTSKPAANRIAYAVAIQTLPNSGSQKTPFADLGLSGGANFLLVLDGRESARLLVADSYNPYQKIPKTAAAGEVELVYRRAYTPVLQNPGSFGELVVETNRRRFGRDGTVFPSQRYSRSLLRFGNGNPSAGDYDSLSEWFTKTGDGTILVRLPWGKLLVTDPSTRQVFSGFDASARAHSATSPGIGLTLFAVSQSKADDLHSMKLLASFPKAQNGEIQGRILAWRPWNAVSPEMYLKKSYYALQREYNEQAGNYDMASGTALDSAILAH